MGRPLIRQFDDVALELLPDLREAIVEREKSEPSYGALTVGGWHSKNWHLFDWDVPVVGALERALIGVIGIAGCKLAGWAVINRSGNYHKRHHHKHKRATDLSGIYYVDAGGVPSANTIFEIPVSEGGGEAVVMPRAGRLLLFPSSTWHRVEAHLGGGMRITVAFDVQ